MAQARPTPPGTGKQRQGALGVAYLLLALFMVSVITWLAFSGPPESRPGTSAVVVKLHRPLEPEARVPDASNTTPSTATSPHRPKPQKIVKSEHNDQPVGARAPLSPPPISVPAAAPEAPSPPLPSAKTKQPGNKPKTTEPAAESPTEPLTENATENATEFVGAPPPALASLPVPPPAGSAKITLPAATALIIALKYAV